MKREDTNGFWEIEGNPISCAGVYPYLGAHLPGAPDPAKVYMVLRPPEELGRPETVESFKLQPWVIAHAMLGPKEKGLTPPEEKGIHGVIGEKVYFDETVEPPTLFGNIKGFSEELKAAIGGGTRQLSAGYFHDLEWKRGIWNGQEYEAVQRNISGNHLASVPAGRMGPGVAVMDSLRGFDPNPFTLNTSNGQENETMEQEELYAMLHDVTERLKALEEARTSGQDERGTTARDGEGEEPENAGVRQTGSSPASSPTASPTSSMDAELLHKKILRDITGRDALATALVPHVGSFDHSLMTEREVAAYGCEKLGVPSAPGHESTALRAYLKGMGAARGPVFSLDSSLAAPAAQGKSRKMTDYLKEGN